MHELLRPNHLSTAEAVRACRGYLASRWRRWGAARRLLPAAARDELTVLLAWHRLTRELLEARQDTAAARRALGECLGMLDEMERGELTRPLAAALAPVAVRHRLSGSRLRERLVALERDGHVHAYETREDLLALATRIARPEGRLLLRPLGAATERNEVLADALSTGLQLAAWIIRLRPALQRGRLLVPMEDLARHGVELRALEEGRMDAAVRRLVGERIAEARAWLHKGWPLCEALGPWRGRQLAFVLRWHAASLSAVEARGGDVLAGPPPAGLLRLTACVLASAARRTAPW